MTAHSKAITTAEATIELGQKFWSKVDRRGPDECWPWQGCCVQGYGQFYFQGGNALAHRVAYKALVGEIPPGLTIDHLCRNRGCVNPAHLEPVTPAENTRRGEAGQARKRFWEARSHCLRGHEFTPENLRNRPYRACRICSNQKERERRAAKRRKVS